MSTSAVLLLTGVGQLHLYCDDKFAVTLSSYLPVHTPLWAAVDVSGCCVQLKSEILSMYWGS
jgi:hypothetical protein